MINFFKKKIYTNKKPPEFSSGYLVFMKNVRKHGGKAYNGLRMLMYQAVSAYELFLHKNVPEDFLEELYEELDT